MVDNQKHLYISGESVRIALESILFKGKQESALLYLTLVDQFLSDADLPPIERPREYALHNILTTIIAQELTTHRQIFQLDPPAEADEITVVHEQILLDGQQQVPDLIGWSMLYYRYVRVDLNISSKQYVQIANQNERNLRRYQATIINERLPHILADTEWQARSWRRQLRLHSVLPSVQVSHFVGRQHIMQQAQQALNNMRPQHILITGAKGIGKTTFVEMLIRQMIDSDMLDHVVWIESPRSPDHIMHVLHQELLHEETKFTVKDFMLINRVTVVLDDLSFIAHELNRLQQLWQELSSAVVVTTHLVYLPLSSDFRHLVLSELSRESAMNLIKLMRSEQPTDNVENYADEVWRRVKGNPFAIKMMVNTINNLEIASPLADESVAEEIFRASYTILDDDSRTVLLMLSLFPAKSVATIEQLRAIWQHIAVKDAQFVQLLSCGLVQTQDAGNYLLNSNAQQFVPTVYENDNYAAEITDQLVRAIESVESESFDLIENILFSHWPPIDDALAEHWTRLCFDEGLRRGHYATWAHIVEQLNLEALDVKLNRAICLRRLGNIEEAYDTFNQVIGDAGLNGDFSLQGRGLIELSGMLRQQGRYEEAQSRLSRVLVDKQNEFDVALERAQIAFDRGDYASALAVLERSYHPNSVRVWALLSEISLEMGNLAQGAAYVQSALDFVGDDHFFRGRLYSIRARILDAQGKDSQTAYELALTVLQRENDQFGLARCQTNFAATLIDAKRDFNLAQQLLQDATESQKVLKDAVGLLTTRHNLNALDRAMI